MIKPKNVSLFVMISATFIMLMDACKNDPLVEDGPEEFVTTTLPPNCSPDTVYFKEQITPLLQANCAITGCHGNGSSSRGVDLSSYTSIINTADVRVNDPSGSMLYEVLIETDLSNRMPPPPRDAFSQAEADAVLKWIEQGALNNSCTE